jgi:hypothetical protein
MDIETVYYIPISFFLMVIFILFRLRMSGKYDKEKRLKDHYTFLNMINSYKRNNHRIPVYFDGYIFGRNCYPILIPWVLSFFSEKTIQRYIDKYFGHIIDLLHFILIITLSIILFDDPVAVFISGLVFIVTPTFLLDTDRTFSISARAFGELLISMFMVLVVLTLPGPSIIPMLIGSLLVALVLLSHRFAIQILVFYIVALAIFYSPWYLAMLVLGMIIATILSKGGYLRVLNGHISGILMFRELEGKNDMVKGETDVHKIVRFFLNPLKNHKLLRNNLVYSMMMTPTIIVLPFIILHFFREGLSSGPITFMLFWTIITLIAIFLTSLKVLRFLGQSFRYLDYAVFPLTIMVTYYFLNVEPYLSILLVFIVAYSLFLIIRFNRSKKGKCKDLNYDPLKKNEFLAYLKGLRKSNLLVIPMNFSHEVIHRTGHNCLFYPGTIELSKLKEYLRIINYYPLPIVAMSVKTYNIDYIILDIFDRQLSESVHREKIIASLNEYQQVFNNGDYWIYRTEKQKR